MNAMNTAPRDGSTVNIHFNSGDKLVTSCTRYFTAEGRWNGMCKGEEPLGWSPAPLKQKTVDPFS